MRLSTLFQSMSPASVNGVAEIVYTPFADASSSWVMGLTFPELRKRHGWWRCDLANVHLAHLGQQSIYRPLVWTIAVARVGTWTLHG